jgi:hypothetical protein
MQIDHIVALATSQFIGRLIRRIVVAIALGFFAIIAVYHFTAAGEIALAAQYGALTAQLVVGSIYSVIALILLAILWALGRKASASTTAPALGQSPREMQIVMLVEAAMLGYCLARKRERAS